MALTLNGTTGIAGIAGSAGTPALQGNNDTNTGYFFGTDILGLSTGGTSRLYITSDGKIGINTTSPANALDVQAGTTNTAIVARSTDAKAQISLVDNSTTSVGCVVLGAEGNELFLTSGSSGSEALRIDSAGRILIGTTSSKSNLNSSADASGQLAQFVGAADDTNKCVGIFAYSGTSNPTARGAKIQLNRARSTDGSTNTALANDDLIGAIEWKGNDGTNFSSAAKIDCFVEDTSVTADHMGGRLVFSTSADGSAVPTQRLRITSNGSIGAGTVGGTYSLELENKVSNDVILSLKNSTNNEDCGIRITGAHTGVGNRTSKIGHTIVTSGTGLQLHSPDNIVFYTGSTATERFRIDDNGVKFQGDTAADSALDDYEEGTWTAGLITGTATHDKTTYRKIGSIVHIWGRLYSPSNTTSSNDVIVTGLPFAVADGTAVGSCMGKDISNKETLTIFVNTNEYLYFYGLQSSNAWNVMKHSNFGGNVELYYHATYWTT